MCLQSSTSHHICSNNLRMQSRCVSLLWSVAESSVVLPQSPFFNSPPGSAAKHNTHRPYNITMRHGGYPGRVTSSLARVSASTCGPCQGHLLSGDAAHDLCLPDWDSRRMLRETCKEWFQCANFQQRASRVDYPMSACESGACASCCRLSGVQAKLTLVINPAVDVDGVLGVRA